MGESRSAADDGATAVIGEDNPVAATPVAADNGDGAAVDINDPRPAKPHAACLFLSQPRRAAATAVMAVMAIMARALPTIAITVVAAKLDADAEYGAGGGQRGRARRMERGRHDV